MHGCVSLSPCCDHSDSHAASRRFIRMIGARQMIAYAHASKVFASAWLAAFFLLVSMLCTACGSGAGSLPEKAEAEASSAEAYRICVRDEASNPVSGAVVQFCRDDLCLMGTTDESGRTAFAEPEGRYEVHVLKAPDGYLADEKTYAMTDIDEELVITLKAE